MLFSGGVAGAVIDDTEGKPSAAADEVRGIFHGSGKTIIFIFNFNYACVTLHVQAFAL